MTVLHPQYLQELGTPARYDRQLIGDLVTAGVAQVGDMLVTSAGSPRSVSVAKGTCYVVGDENTDQGTYRVFNDGAVVLTHDAAVTNPRLDQIVVRVFDSTEHGSGSDGADLEIVKGAESSGATLINRTGAASVLPPNCQRLADVLVPVGASPTIASDHIADRRLAASTLTPFERNLLGIDIKRWGASIIPTSESPAVSGSTWVLMPTPDVVPNVVIEENTILFVLFQAFWSQASNIASNVTNAAVCLDGIPVVRAQADQASPVAAAATITAPGSPPTKNAILSTFPGGLQSTLFGTGVTYTGDVGTGQVVGSYDPAATGAGITPHRFGAMEIFADPGTYDVSVRFNKSAGSAAPDVQDRKLWVWTRPLTPQPQ